MKYLILHADGMTDIPCPELGGKTPLASGRDASSRSHCPE